MVVATLPASVTRWLNALQHGFADEEDLWADFDAERTEFGRWMDRDASFSVDEPEAAVLGNLHFCWAQVEHAAQLEAMSLEGVARSLIEAYSLREQVRSERRRHGLSLSELVNGALLAIQAHLAGRLDRGTLDRWWPTLEAYQEAAWERGLVRGIPASEKGFTAFAQGLAEWRALAGTTPANRQAWEEVSGWLRFGAEAIEAFMASLPVQDTFPEVLFAGLEGETTEEAFEQLAQVSEDMLVRLSVPTAVRAGLEDQLDHALECLRQGLDGRADSYHQGVQEVSQLWKDSAAAESRQPAPRGEEEAALWSAVSGALKESVPDLILADLLDYYEEVSESPPPAASALRRYLADGDIAQLHAALDLLLSDFARPI